MESLEKVIIFHGDLETHEKRKTLVHNNTRIIIVIFITNNEVRSKNNDYSNEE